MRYCLRFALSKNRFGINVTLNGTFEVRNTSGFPRRFDFQNQQQFGYSLFGNGSQPVLSFPNGVQPATSYFTLNSGETKAFLIISPSRDPSGQLIDSGQYTLFVYLLSGESPRVSIHISVRSRTRFDRERIQFKKMHWDEIEGEASNDV